MHRVGLYLVYTNVGQKNRLSARRSPRCKGRETPVGKRMIQQVTTSSSQTRSPHRRRSGLTPQCSLSLENEGNLHRDAKCRDLPVLNVNFLVLYPCTANSFDGFGGAGNALLHRILKRRFRRRSNFNNLCNRHENLLGGLAFASGVKRTVEAEAALAKSGASLVWALGETCTMHR
jgi:hypothetical protein